jgi:heme-degrading monooxygenase HmoA
MTSAVVTMVEGVVPDEGVSALLEAFPGPDEQLPPFIIGTSLSRETTSNRWRVVTIWKSQADLEEYVASVETPAALAAFRAAGVEPDLSIWEADRVMLSGG